MPDDISIGGRPAGDPSDPAPWQEQSAPAYEVDGVVDLATLATALLDQARGDHRGRATAMVLKHPLQRSMAIALLAGQSLAEHVSPPAANLQCLAGRVRLYAAGTDDEWILLPRQIAAIPPERHAVDALEDSVVLLTVST